MRSENRWSSISISEKIFKALNEFLGTKFVLEKMEQSSRYDFLLLSLVDLLAMFKDKKLCKENAYLIIANNEQLVPFF